MSKYLRQSTASQEIMIGRCVDSTDGNTEETALSIANTDIKLFKEGATTLASKNSGGGTHVANGIYSAVLDATDTNTLGQLKAYVHVSGMLAWEDSWTVLPAQVYDSLVLGTDLLDISVVQNNGSAITQSGGRQEVNVSHFGGTAGTFAAGRAEVNTSHAAGTAWGSGAITAASIAADAITAAKIANGAIDAATFAASAIDATAIATGAITAAKFAASAIDATAIATGAITAAKFAADAITSTVIANSAINANKLAANCITSGKFATDAIDSNALAASAVTEIQAGMLTAISSGTAQAGTTTSVTLAAGESSLTNAYRLDVVTIMSGTGAGQSRLGTAYNGTSKVLTVDPAFDLAPDNTSVYRITPFGTDPANVSTLVAAVWAAQRDLNNVAGSFGEMVHANMRQISDDAAAADILELLVEGGATFPVDVRYINGKQVAGDGITTQFFVLP